MKYLIDRIKEFSGTVSFGSLLEFVKDTRLQADDYSDHIPAADTVGDYGRNILTLEPFECVLIQWPAGVESAIHHHKGLFGHVLVLEGELDDHRYTMSNGVLREESIISYGKDGIMPEPDGVIHKLRNGGTDRAVTLHFYYPAIESFEGMRLYNVDDGSIGVLGAQANSASWSSSPNHFKSVQRSVFSFESLESRNQSKSHVRATIIPKPDKARIEAMNTAYFCEQAEQYDFSDFNQPNRRSYIERIDGLIAEDLQASSAPRSMLDMACGTGRRSANIRKLSGHQYPITGIDISPGMREVAASRGLKVHELLENVSNTEKFDVATFLYAFGHLADSDRREYMLHAIHDRLTSRGVLYLDLFSIDNQNEWGPLAVKSFEEQELEKYGYERGDIFYRKVGSRAVAFIHYFSEEEARKLLKACGYEIEWVKYVGYAKNPGQLVLSAQQGNLFVKAMKP